MKLVPSRVAEWAERYAAIAPVVAGIVPDAHIEHIGSTAVPGILAKDVVDVLVGVAEADVQRTAAALADTGFDLEGVRPGHCWLSMPDRTARHCIIHVVGFDGTRWAARLAFRDRLRSDPVARAEYQKVKVEAADKAQGWGDYTAAKYPTVAKLLHADNGS
ncbi:GrpB family protein [Tersicoccus sp. MR15.9]|uniref:GrpB family protein n=1 Tax=Tersicoccus mangrovi TaxID=3121635 RepID=UPI002FE647A8